MNVRILGSGDGPAIVLVHGIPGSGAVWNDVAAELSKTHRVVIPDLLGFGASPRPARFDELWIENQGRALARALAENGISSIILAGHDFGGPVSLALASDAASHVTVRALVLAAANAFPDTPIPLPIRSVTWPFVGGIAGGALFSRPSLAMMLRQGSSRPLDPAHYLGDRRQVEAIATIFGGALRELRERYEPVESALRGLSIPVLVLWGEKDPFFSVAQGERTAAAAADGRLVVFAGAKHFLPSERPREFARELAAFCASVP